MRRRKISGVTTWLRRTPSRHVKGYPIKSMVTLMNNGNHSRALRPTSIYLGDLTYTTLSLATDAFPLNIGFIAAYAEKIFGK